MGISSYIYVFDIGVLNLVATIWFVAGIPFLMPYFYTVKFVVLMINRIITYVPAKNHLFMLDFCYFENILLILYLFVWGDNPHLFQVVFAAAHGPLLWAIFTFRNSLVFHSVDKITSALIHMTPCIITWILRWRRQECVGWPDLHTWDICKQSGEGIPDKVCGFGYRDAGEILPFSFGALFGDSYCPIWFMDFFVWPFVFYQIWFILYGILMTTYLRAQMMETNEDGSNVYGTAYGFLTNDSNGKLRNAVKVLGDSESGKLFMYFVMNSTFIAFTLIFPMFMWSRFWLHTGCILAGGFVCVHNGSSFYVKVFSQGRDVPLLLKKLDAVGQQKEHEPEVAVSFGAEVALQLSSRNTTHDVEV